MVDLNDDIVIMYAIAPFLALMIWLVFQLFKSIK